MDTEDLAMELLFELKQNGYRVPNRDGIDEDKKNLIDQIKDLREIAKNHDLAGFDEDLKRLEERVKEYRITVPVMGEFSVGKSTLLNTHLGRDILSTDLKPETAIATELHYAPAGEEKIVIHRLDGTSEELLTSSIERIKERAKEIMKAELHLNAPSLSAHRDVILVDMPGFSSGEKAHNKAMQNYVTGSSAFILCVAADQGLRESSIDMLQQLDILNEDINLVITRSETRYNDLDSIVRNITDQVLSIGMETDSAVETTSAISGDIDGFRRLINHIDNKKSQLLKEHFEPLIEGIAVKLSRTLQIIGDDENIDINELERQRKKIEQDVTDLDRIVTEETDRLKRDFAERLPDQVTQDVKAVLMSNLASLHRDMIKGRDISHKLSGMAQQAISRSIECRSKDHFERVCQSLSTRLSRMFHLEGAPGDTSSLSLSIGEISMEETMGSGSCATIAGTIGFFIGGPIGAAIAGFIGGLIGSRKREKAEQEAREALEMEIENIAGRVRSSVRTPLEDLAQKFCDDLRLRIDEKVKEWNGTLTEIERELTKNREQDIEHRKRLSRDRAILDRYSKTTEGEIVQCR